MENISDECAVLLVESYKSLSVLWDPKDKDYFKKKRKRVSFFEIFGPIIVNNLSKSVGDILVKFL
jgi:hypothetical protein